MKRIRPREEYLEPEEWRSVPGFVDYEVSSHGRVRKIKYLATSPDGRHVQLYYEGSKYRHNRGGHTVAVGFLVLVAFKGPPPAPYMVQKKEMFVFVIWMTIRQEIHRIIWSGEVNQKI